MLPPSSWVEVVILPALAVFFGVLLYGLALRLEATGERVRWKWLPLGVLFVGVLAGFAPFWAYVGPSVESEIYRGSIPGRKMLAAHWAAFLGPLLCLVAILVYELWWRRRPDPEH